MGIDIGTSNTSIAVNNGSSIYALNVSEGAVSIYGGEKMLPSAVYADDESGNLILGHAAYSIRMNHPERFAHEFKREFGNDIPLVLGEQQYSVDQIYKKFFRKLMDFAEKVGTVTDACITHPADYPPKTVARLENIAKYAGIPNITMVDEPSAAAASYITKADIAEGASVLVYDFGGGTFDVSFIEKTKTGFRHLTKPLGLSDCGGSDFDRLILDDIVETLTRECGEDMEKLLQDEDFALRFMPQMLERAITAKITLSQSNVYSETFFLGYSKVNYSITREKFNGMIAPYVDRTCELVKKIIGTAGKTKSGVKKVLLIGGSCRIPYIRSRISEMFSADKIVDVENPELAVCLGAAGYSSYLNIEETDGESDGGGISIEDEEKTRQTDSESDGGGISIEDEEKTRQAIDILSAELGKDAVMKVDDACMLRDGQICVNGYILCDKVEQYQKVIVYPSEARAVISGIAKDNDNVHSVHKYDSVYLRLRNVAEKDIQKGSVIRMSSEEKVLPPKVHEPPIVKPRPPKQPKGPSCTYGDLVKEFITKVKAPPAKNKIDKLSDLFIRQMREHFKLSLTEKLIYTYKPLFGEDAFQHHFLFTESYFIAPHIGFFGLDTVNYLKIEWETFMNSNLSTEQRTMGYWAVAVDGQRVNATFPSGLAKNQTDFWRFYYVDLQTYLKENSHRVR